MGGEKAVGRQVMVKPRKRIPPPLTSRQLRKYTAMQHKHLNSKSETLGKKVGKGKGEELEGG